MPPRSENRYFGRSTRNLLAFELEGRAKEESPRRRFRFLLFEPDDGGASVQSVIGIVVGTVGLIGLGVGVGFGIDAMQKNNEAMDICDGNRCVQRGVDLNADAKSSATASTIGFAAGGVLTAGGLMLFLTSDF